MKSMAQPASSDRQLRRMVPIVAIGAALLVLAAFIKTYLDNRTIPYSYANWITGRGKATTSNPRLLMEREVVLRLKGPSFKTRAEVERMLGPGEPRFSISYPKSGSITPGDPTKWIYILGVEKVNGVRTLRYLTVGFDKKGDATSVYASGADFPEGCTVVPAASSASAGTTPKPKATGGAKPAPKTASKGP